MYIPTLIFLLLLLFVTFQYRNASDILKKLIYVSSLVVPFVLSTAFALLLSLGTVSFVSDNVKGVPWFLFVVSILYLFLALLVYLRDKFNITNILFSLFTVFFMVWSILNYYSTDLNFVHNKLLLIRLILFFAILMTTTYVLFVYSFLRRTLKPKRWVAYYCLLSFLISALSLSPLVFSSLKNVNGLLFPDANYGIVVIFFYAILSLLIVIKLIISRIRSVGANHGMRKDQFILLILSLIIFVAIPVTNLFLTLYFETEYFARYSFIYSFLIVLIVAYVIFKKDFMYVDERIVRVGVYIASIITISILPTLSIYIFSTSYFNLDTNFSTFAAIVITLFAGLSFWTVKSAFDKGTRKVFFQDSYDMEKVLDNLADALISQDDLDHLLENTLEVYSKAIKPSFSMSTAISKNEVISKSRISDSKDDIKLSDANIKDIKDWKVKKIDELPDGDLKEKFQTHKIELVSITSRNGKVNGVFLFGPKQTGTPYNAKDIELLKISGKNLALAIENANRFREISDFNVYLRKEIDEATLQLKDSNKRLREIDKSKDEFISMASHQLRTPLTAIKNMTLLNKDKKFGEVTKAQQEALNSTYENTERMIQIIDELLNVSRIESGNFHLERKKIRMVDMVKNVVKHSEKIAEVKKVKIITSYPENDVQLKVDEVKIKEVISNFIDNAIQYSRKNSEVHVTLELTQQNFELTVEDSGIGISTKDSKKLFTKFYRANNAKKVRPDGTGLGLYLAKKVINEHGGEITFESKKSNGSKFGFVLPINS